MELASPVRMTRAKMRATVQVKVIKKVIPTSLTDVAASTAVPDMHLTHSAEPKTTLVLASTKVFNQKIIHDPCQVIYSKPVMLNTILTKPNAVPAKEVLPAAKVKEVIASGKTPCYPERKKHSKNSLNKETTQTNKSKLHAIRH